jgi:hypothetical protein
MTDIKTLLLQLITERYTVTQQQLDNLSNEQWQTLFTLAKSHRIGPLLHHKLRERKLYSPEEIAVELDKLYQQSALRSLTSQAELLKLHRLLENAGIHFIALKGSYLATKVYPSSAIRPMRDIDLLLPEKELRTAYQLLLEAGYTHPPRYQGDPEAMFKIGKHLPPLLSPAKIVIELHDKVLHPEDWGNGDFTDEPDFWQHCTTTSIGNKRFPVMCATDLLLHLIIHACFDHKFNNGPLTFPDIAFLLKKKSIDWKLFWQKAKEGGGEKGCTLVLFMIKHYYPDISIEGLAEDEQLTKDALRFSLLTLQDYHSRRDLNSLQLLVHNGVIAKIKTLFSKVFPSKAKISSLFPVSINSPFIYCYYPRNWLLILQKFPSFINICRQQKQRDELLELAAFKKWLKAASK